MIKKKILIFIVLLVLPFCLAEQVLWNNDSDIIVYDIWTDINGLPLTGADCSWYVFNSDGTLNQSGTPTELTDGIINFTVNRLDIEIYPLLINCTKNTYNGTSSLREIKIVDELSEEYKDRLVEINQTTHDIYDSLINDINTTLKSILNLTDLTYDKIVEIDSNLNNLITKVDSLKTYLEDKWGAEDASDIVDRLKDIANDVAYLKLQYPEEGGLLLSIKKDSREVLNLMHGKEIDWEKILIFGIPILILLIIIIVIIISNRKKGGENG